MGTLILVILTLSAGIAVYVVMQAQAERILSESLDLTVRGNVRMFERQLRQWVQNSETIATRPYLIDTLSAWRYPGRHPREQAALERASTSFLGTGFSAVRFLDAHNHVVAEDGSFVHDSAIRVPVLTSPAALLLWDGGLVLRSDVVMRKNGEMVGQVVTERHLTVLRAAFSQATALGSSSELAVCGPGGAEMQCFPSNLHRHVLLHLPDTLRGRYLPMYYAIQGRTGTILARDYRGVPVVAAYAPIGHLGLGMVLKIDQRDLFEPVTRELRKIGLLLVVLVGLGIFLLEWTVTPLVRKLVLSERDAREIGERLQESERRTRTILDSVSEGILTVDPDGLIETLNPAAQHIFGYRSEEATGRGSDLLMPDLAAMSQGERARGRVLMAGPGRARELTGVRRNGQRFPLEVKVSVVHAHGRDLRIVLARDITERKESEQRVLYLANHDALTGLPNRILLQARINLALQESGRLSQQVAVLFIDLDHFKTINDSLGHDVGDLLLQAVAGRLRSAVRPGDTVARQGGDEFIVVLAEVSDGRDAELVAQHLQRVLRSPYRLGGHDLRTTASIGISLFPDHGRDADTLLKSSDIAMYLAKAADRGSVRVFESHMNQRVAADHSLRTHLHDAIERDELELYFQPIVSVATQAITGLEALLRWRHPENGLVGPVDFIPFAEETGLIIPIGEWVLKAVCTCIQAWSNQGYLVPKIAINLSARQCREWGLVTTVSRIVTDAGISPHQLELELTESVLMENTDAVVATLEGLRDLGFEIAIDDFGTGYSSLSYLKRFPIHTLKIDRSFIKDLVTDPGDVAIIAAIITMAHGLGIRVTAEGVETQEQLYVLGHQGCDQFQGRYLSDALPANEIIQYLTRKAALSPVL